MGRCPPRPCRNGSTGALEYLASPRLTFDELLRLALVDAFHLGLEGSLEFAHDLLLQRRQHLDNVVANYAEILPGLLSLALLDRHYVAQLL